MKFAWFILSISSWKRLIQISQDEKMSWNLSSIDVVQVPKYQTFQVLILPQLKAL